MKKINNFLILLFFLYITLQMITHSPLFINSVQESISIWKSNILSTIFPFLILSEFLINYGFINLINFLCGKIFKKIFNVNSNIAFVFFMSIISGFPSSSIYINDLYQKKLITLDDANKALIFCHFSNPLFIIGFIGTIIGFKYAIYILFIHYISSIIIGILFRKLSNGNEIQNNKIILKFGTILKNAITKGIDNLLLILGTIIFFNIIITSLSLINLPNIIVFIINIFLELTNGINYILLNIKNLEYQCLLISALLSFGGLCVHFQVISILENTKIKYQKYLIARIIQAIISSILVLITFNFVF